METTYHLLYCDHVIKVDEMLRDVEPVNACN